MYFLRKHSQRASQTILKYALKHFQRALSNIFKERSQSFPKSALLSLIGTLHLAPYSLKFSKNRSTKVFPLFSLEKPKRSTERGALFFKNRCSSLALHVEVGIFGSGSRKKKKSVPEPWLPAQVKKILYLKNNVYFNLYIFF